MDAQAQHKESQVRQWEYYTDMPVGEILRRARMHYGQSLNDVESVLRIRAIQLEAIEDGRLEQLPGRVYAIGFVRAYSEYLGLDGDKMVHLFKIQSVGSKARPELNFPVAASDSKLPGVFLVAASLLAVIFLIFMLSTRGGKEEKAQPADDIPTVEEEMKTAPPQPAPAAAVAPSMAAAPSQVSLPSQAAAPEAGVAARTDQAAAPASAPILAPAPAMPAAPPAHVIINVLDTTWVEIRDAGGKPIISQILNPGETYIVPDQKNLVLATGNIGGLEFVVDGVKQPAFGVKGDIARGVSLDPAALKARAGSQGARQPARAPGETAVPAAAPDAAGAGDWRSSIRPAPAMPPQPVPVQSGAPQEAQPMALPGAASGTVR